MSHASSASLPRLPHLKKDKEATLLAAAAEEEKAREAKQAAQKEAERQRKQVLCPRQAVSLVFFFSLNHCSLPRSLLPVCSHLFNKDSIVSLVPCLCCPATHVSSFIFCPLQAPEKEADEQRKRGNEATRLAAAEEQEKAHEAKEAAQKEAEQQRRQVLCPQQAVSFNFSFSLTHLSRSRFLVPVCSELVNKDSIASLMPCLGCPATGVSSCILSAMQAENEADEQRKKDKEATTLAALPLPSHPASCVLCGLRRRLMNSAKETTKQQGWLLRKQLPWHLFPLQSPSEPHKGVALHATGFPSRSPHSGASCSAQRRL